MLLLDPVPAGRSGHGIDHSIMDVLPEMTVSGGVQNEVADVRLHMFTRARPSSRELGRHGVCQCLPPPIGSA
ncbi:hypothetical protein B7R22_03830 [Subtercola boreus]|uniref:Uncharacterized protein n=1 Tax=Subtercola boreus TaxID=120213 RepID=A0A3E0W537_9MICO|nr:hypothetical protein B7R22_03830 [Subtercola boreus]